MATSPSHRFGQIIGDLLEEIMAPRLEEFCRGRGLYLDKKGSRGAAREGKKVSWVDKFGNSHDLDFVIEKGGTASRRGRPLAFIEAAWRRYTKHSRNKAQEIQGAVLPIAEKHDWDKPFLGVVLAGVFTEGSLSQMKSSGFEVMLFPYETITEAFASVGVDAEFDEDTPDAVFQRSIDKIEALPEASRNALKDHLMRANAALLKNFLEELEKTLDRRIETVILIPLHGSQNEFCSVSEAISFIESHDQSEPPGGGFRKYEVIVRYTNGDKIDASFADKDKAVAFLRYVGGV
jgi:hypothetical protein